MKIKTSEFLNINEYDLFEIHKWKNPMLPFITHFNHHDFSITGNWHDSIELLWILDGSGEIYSDIKKYEVKQGDICVINSEEVHRITSSDHITYHCLIIGITFFAENGFDMSNLKFNTKINDKELEALFQNVVDEMNESEDTDSYKIPSVRSAVLRLMVYLSKNHKAPCEKGKSSAHSDIIRRGLEYINSNFTKQLTLEDISKQVGVSKYHFLREFKRYTGYTVVSYISKLRSEYAKRLFQSTELSVSDVARACGYETLSYFTESFKKHTGMLPSHYNAKNQKAK